MNLKIRHELPEDYRIVEEITRECFWNLYFPGCEEHFLISNMRKHEDFIPELSYIMEIDNKIIGGIFYTNSKIVSDNGKEHNMITFGPVFIHPDFQRKGFGRKLIMHSIEEAKKQGYKGILTLGYPYHYEPYGFLGGKKYGVCMGDGNFYKGLLVLPLFEEALNNISGSAVFSNVFEVDKIGLEDFDKKFPHKEKLVKDSQKEYEIACSQLD